MNDANEALKNLVKMQNEIERLAAVVSDIERLDCSRVKTLRDDPSLIHCPIDRPCQKHRLERLQAKLDKIATLPEKWRHLGEYWVEALVNELEAILEADDEQA